MTSKVKEKAPESAFVWMWLPETTTPVVAGRIDRDGDTYRPHWERWARQEDRHIARDQPSRLATHVFAVP